MPHPSPFSIPIPCTDVLSYLFPPSCPPSTDLVWIDAVDTSKSLSPAQLLQWVKRLGFGLQKLGLREDDVVMIYSSNHIFVPVAYLGIAGSGCIFTGCNPAYGADEMAYQIQNTGTKAILCAPELLDTALKAAAKEHFPKDRVYLFDDSDCAPIHGIKDWKNILGTEEEARTWTWTQLSADEAKQKTAVLNYSSGTTGLPKGVMITHQNIIANTVQSLHMRQLTSGDPSIPPTPQTSTGPERWLGFLPLYHAYGQLWTIVAAAATRTPTYMMRTFSFQPFLSHMARHRITHLQTAPPVVVLLAKRPETARHDLGSLRNVLCGAAPLSRELQNEVSEKLDVKVVQTWGMTEVTCSSLHVPGLVDDRSGSVGLPDPGTVIKLADDAGREVQGPGVRGEIFVKGPNVCRGYWRNESATRDAFDEEGFLKTGDVAVRDERGWFWIVDRKKELIKVKGFQVAPAELEAVLLEHDGLADAAVVGLQAEHGQELPRAYVVRKEDAKKNGLKESHVVEWIGGKVASHKRLDGGVAFIEEVPKSPSGKIQRKVLREWAKKDSNVGNQAKAKL
ncbi:4-coumarate-CoA ligase [Lineolata rhizophorae]|uniref:4-coumarate-CoA ligase n=1 Tax=Lineolata rhizophorae TaxID=578093 RepID=A0A6A6NV31_9PEZI|nr:4-coumarate-CoA ligase [Lineolata rhizophorae]